MSDPTQHPNMFDPGEDLFNARGLDAFSTASADGAGQEPPLVAVTASLHRRELDSRRNPLARRAEFLIRLPFRSTASASFGLPQTLGQF